MLDPLTTLCAVSLAMALVPAYFYFRNRTAFPTAPPAPQGDPEPALSVLIPARDEGANIAGCVGSVLAASAGVRVEVVVYDDASDDDTPAIVQRLATADPRVRLVRGAGPPDGWNGKQHACWRLAEAARHDTLLWIDADVRLEPASLARLVAHRRACGADLLSGFPRQVTVTTLERWLLPLIHFLLLGFLSLRGMRKHCRPSLAAGCGQLFLTDKAAYRLAGGHAAIRSSRHDGVTLPRAYRHAGLRTDLVDATDLASCRMYHSGPAVWNGLTKNATEGFAKPGLLVVVTAMLLAGQTAPWLLTPLACAAGEWGAAWMAGLALALGYAQRLDAALRFRQPLDGAAAHPIAVVLLLVIQWEALLRDLVGKPAEWRGRPAATTS
ncbi:glycosyltransferase family 2 protein [Botrimarina sp.]|uniref:glycosyltransferase family 2 protein n=1 Tax=Botrimarina sp. TaxID=2795802 RepID=UPI0032EF361A